MYTDYFYCKGDENKEVIIPSEKNNIFWELGVEY